MADNSEAKSIFELGLIVFLHTLKNRSACLNRVLTVNPFFVTVYHFQKWNLFRIIVQ